MKISILKKDHISIFSVKMHEIVVPSCLFLNNKFCNTWYWLQLDDSAKVPSVLDPILESERINYI